MKDTTWKTLAIVFIILFILETLFWIWIVNIGKEIIEIEDREIERKNICAVNICGGGEYDFYNYEDGLCSCYVGTEIKFSEFVTS